MTFFSLEFTTIFLAFLAIYWVFKANFRIQNYIILFFNYMLIFSFSPYFTLVILFHTFFVSYFGLYIHYKKSKDALIASLFFMLLYLCFFKYFDIIYADFKHILLFFKFDLLAKNLDIAFPIGISFYTFASITYLVSVYKKEQEPVKFITLACYLSFFATLLAGPISKSTFLIPQFEQKREFKNADLIFVLILLGVIKKVLIANYLNSYVSDVFLEPVAFSWARITAAIYCYSIWLYCDFSGYVDIVTALGLAIGFTLPVNFNMPYVAVNLRDFWKRWHISLSTFIKDYIYIPLGGNRISFLHTQFILLVAFGLSGIWHGVGVNFFVWGLMHGFGIIFLNIMQRLNLNISSKLPIFCMFFTLSFVSLSWIYFAKSDFSEANAIILAMFDSKILPTKGEYIVLGLLFVLFLAYPYFKKLKDIMVAFFISMPTLFKPFVLSLIFTLIFAIMPDGIPDFIYSSF